MLSTIAIDESHEWDKIIKSFSDYDIYYLSNYTKGFQIHGDGQPNLFYYKDENMRAMNVVMKKDIVNDPNFTDKVPEDTYFDLSTPYGYGGFLIEGEITEESLQNLNKEYKSYCKNNGIVSEFVRFHPVLDNQKDIESLYDVTTLGKTVTMDLKSPKFIWDNLTSKNRNVTRKAIKSGVEIYWGRNMELYHKFIEIYDATMDKYDADDYYYFSEEFYQSVLNDLRYNSLMFYAMHEDQIISMSIILFGNDQMHYHLSASDPEFQNLAPTNLLLYEAASWGSINGFKTLHLGGGLGGKEDSLYKFKKAFSKSSDTMFSIGKKIFDQEKYEELVKIRNKEEDFDKDALFFPIYRA